MKKIFLVLGVFMVAGCSTHIGRPGTAAPEPVRSRYKIVRDVVYTPADWPERLLADVYIPEGKGPFPSVLVIHGGAWKRGDREQVESLAERVAERGYLAVNITYRLLPKYVWPAQLKDVQQAVRWMRSEEGRKFGIDPERVGTFGYSAGAHLAALVAAVADDPKWGAPDTDIKAVLSGGTPSDLPVFKDGRLVPAFIGASYADKAQAYHDASPIEHISKGDPPVFLYHASMDMLVPIDQMDRYKKALDKGGIVNETFVIHGHGHISGFFFDGSAVDAGVEFLDRHLR